MGAIFIEVLTIAKIFDAFSVGLSTGGADVFAFPIGPPPVPTAMIEVVHAFLDVNEIHCDSLEEVGRGEV